jgi:hypothetical protein
MASKEADLRKTKPMTPRHSSLPKLALCGQYEGAPGEAGLAAQRGTKLDAIFRMAWQTGDMGSHDTISDEDAGVVRWAINAMMRLRTTHLDVVETDEDKCRVRTPGMEHVGTADAICAHGGWHADLKTGQIYDYEAQMAAYALGLMHHHMRGSWTAHLIFADQQKVVSRTFTYAEAREIVSKVLANIGTSAVINDYCGWCAKSLTCSARVTATETTLATTHETFAAMLADPSRLGEFLLRCKTFDDFREAAEAEARRLLGDGVEVPGWRLQKPRVSEFVDAEVLIGNLANLDPAELLRAHGSMSAAKARKLWPDVPVARKESKPALVAVK